MIESLITFRNKIRNTRDFFASPKIYCSLAWNNVPAIIRTGLNFRTLTLSEIGWVDSAGDISVDMEVIIDTLTILIDEFMESYDKNKENFACIIILRIIWERSWV